MHKNKNISIVLLFAIVSSIFGSCTKLELKPTDSIDPTKAFRNAADVNMGVIGVYALLENNMGQLSSTVSDENMYPIENTVGNSDAFRWFYTGANGSVTSFYNSAYKAIDGINRVLAAIERISAGSDDAQLPKYKGELLALRAYLHFELLRAYASGYENDQLGIPYMTVSEISYPSRPKFQEVIANVKADLTNAKTLIEPSLKDMTRMTRTAVSALQARVALYEKNWPEAITFSTEVIDALPLATTTEFADIWLDKSNKEVVWKLKRVGTTNSRIGDFYYRESGDYVLYAPAFKLINMFDRTNDVRFASYIKYAPERTGNKSKYLVNKFIGGTAATPRLVDIKLFRTAEMYLIRAEAKTESQGNGNDDLNVLRKARIKGYSNVNISNKAQLLQEIEDERFKELAFEGHRFFDLKRRKKNIERPNEDIVNASGAKTLTPSQAQYNLPLPNLEIQVNKNIVQNPNY
ncbi:RagB/SusD family nutrient uptake outer membrane protein [Sphingobacterium sp. BN32]|uniref:RagB/SusD family nutrient uptake outer membrane protein n=1 Tax=Sphingobacterium sp. BN32 TaxID=3058432 RepID=UPI00265D44D0|nr:RagB/SusD family nutrient uptake outer membrane protein [Sphingobacterium sp. BN32]WKK57190.1 RagB/SusD family nutrient uptake outer membrane protein [Sphingobacterium sp. BN32]